MSKRTSVSVFMRFIIMKMKMKMVGLDMDTNIVNIKSASV